MQKMGNIEKYLENTKPQLTIKKQSVRTSFNLSTDCLNNLKKLKDEHGLFTKDVFDLIIQNDDLIKTVIDVIKSEKIPIKKDIEKKRKTYVISKSTLKKINSMSKKHKIKRDLLIEILIRVYTLLLDKIKEKEKESEKKALKLINELLSHAEKIEKEFKKMFDEDNPLIERISTVVVIIMNLSIAIENKLKNNIPIDPYDF